MIADYIEFYKKMVLEMGLEPTHPKAYASETYVSTIPPPEHRASLSKIFAKSKNFFFFSILSSPAQIP